MKSQTLVLLLAALLAAPNLHGQNDPIDWNRAQELRRRALRGDKLTPEESAYYERALAARARPEPAGPRRGPRAVDAAPHAAH